MDIARLAFVSVDVPEWGPVVIDAASGAFEDWRRDGLKVGRWAAGDAFVRDMLRERGRSPTADDMPPENGSPLSSEQIDRLGEAQIEAFAAAFIAEAPYAVRPRLKRDERAKIIERDPSEVDGLLVVGPDERPSDALLRLVRLREEDRALTREKAQMALRPALQEATRAAEILRIATASPLADLIRARDLAYPLLAAVEGIRRQSALFHPVTRNLGLANRANALVGDWSGLARISRLVDADRSIWKAATSGLASSNYLSAAGIVADLNRHPQWTRDLNRLLDLDLTALGRAARGLSAWEEGWAARQGLILTGDAVLAGLAPAGAGAAVVSHYDTTVDVDTTLGRVLLDLQRLDEGEITPEDFAQRVHYAIDAIRPLLNALHRVGTHGAISLLALLIAVLALFVGPPDEKAPPEPVPAILVAEREALARLDEIVESHKQALRESKEARDYRHVVRKTTLRLEPVAGSLPIRTVFPDELIRVLEAKGSWAKVEVHEYATDQVTIGWIARSRLASTD
ncbi:hypothetical protein [Brevundimonas sp.]|uniref:hypothetical protein n=1 Tax=Brevundimonas sp. TaxID=1871086 RepID=UPI002ED8BCCE